MKRSYLKLIIPLLLVLLVPLTIVKGDNLFNQFSILVNKSCEKEINEIIAENSDKELVANDTYKNKFIYLAFKNEEDFVSYYIDYKTGEKQDFTYFLKSGKLEEFENKVKELLYLKYPNFLADAILSEETIKYTEISENALVIHYESVNVEPQVQDKLSLTINYNEIKDYLDFTLLLDSEYENENGYVYDKNKKTIALTFDDGPSGDKTKKIVEALEQNKAHATFFMVGNKMEYGRDVIHTVLNKGNEIGSHSYAHTNMKRQKIEDLIEDEAKTQEIYESITGKKLIYTRPPYGSVNDNIKANLDTIFVTWNLDPEDWLHRDKNYIVNYVMEHVSDGDIILMHDSYDSTVDAVIELLPKLYAAGFQVVSVGELANLKDINLENHSLYRSLKEI